MAGKNRKPAPIAPNPDNRPSQGNGPKDKDGGDDTTYSGGGGGSYAAREAEYRARAAQRYEDQAELLARQAKYYKALLGKKGFRAELKSNLKSIRVDLRGALADSRQQYADRVGILEQQDRDNKNAADAQTYAAMTNAGRERANALSEAMLQGAGESDVLRAQGMALRNWNANQSEVARAFYDTNTSINAGLTDLTADTRTARINAYRSANDSRGQQWSTYYDQRSEAYTQLYNLYGEIASNYGYANEQKGSKRYRDLQDQYEDKSINAIKRLGKSVGQAWENPGVPKRIQKWDGRASFDDDLNQSFGPPRSTDLAKPEGATLRSW